MTSWLTYAIMRGMREEERRKALQYVLNIVGEVRSVLDFGCSTCTLLDLFPESVKKYGVEIDEKARKICEGKGYKVFKDLREAPIVECITMIDVLEHLDPNYFVNELLPVIREKLCRGGKLFIQTYNPYCIFAHMDFYNDYTHRFMWTLDSLKAVLTMCGFKIIKSGYLHPLSPNRTLLRIFSSIIRKFTSQKYLYMEEFVLAKRI